MSKPRIVFMGTPSFAAASLSLLCERGYTPVAVYTQPDKVNGRRGKISFSPVKETALEKNIPVLQPLTFRDEETLETLRAFAPDLIVVIAYGRILPQAALDIPQYGALNIHASLLPKYRGAAPVQRVIIDGEAETGVSLMRLDAGMDTGDVVSVVKIPLTGTETAGALLDTLAALGANELLRVLENLPDSLEGAVPQDQTAATYAEKLTKEMGHIDWTKSAAQLSALIRGMNPDPGTYTFFRGKRVKLHMALPAGEEKKGNPGEIVGTAGGLLQVAAGEGTLSISELQPENKKRMKAADFINGFQVKIGDKFE